VIADGYIDLHRIYTALRKSLSYRAVGDAMTE
jgi:hypothetical protein